MSGPQRFRKKPVEISAYQWDGTAEGATPIINWILSSWPHAAWYVAAGEPHLLRAKDEHDAPGFLVIDTLEGPHRADAGDFIIRGVAGEFYPCKPDIFEQTYDYVEPVVEGSTYTNEQRRYFPVSMRDRLDEGTP